MNDPKHTLIKILMAAFAVVYLGVLFAADLTKDIPMEQIAQAMESDPTITALKKRGDVDLQRYFSIRADSTGGYFYYKAPSPMAVEEILIVKATGADSAGQLLEAVSAHLKSQIAVFESYGTTQMGYLNKALTKRKGSYVWYMCGPDAQNWEQNFLKLI